MAIPIIVFLVVALVVLLTITKARARRRALLRRVQATVQGVSGQDMTLKEGNVSVRVKTSVNTEGAGMGSVGDQIAQALSNISPEQLQAQMETALHGMRDGGNMQLSEQQRRVVEAALRNGFGKGATVTFDTQPLQAAEAADVFSALDAEPVSVPPSVVHTAPAPPSSAGKQDAENQDPFSPGDVFDRHQKAADASFDNAAANRDTSKNRDPFS